MSPGVSRHEYVCDGGIINRGDITSVDVFFLESLGCIPKPVPILHSDISLSPQLLVPVSANLPFDLDEQIRNKTEFIQYSSEMEEISANLSDLIDFEANLPYS